MKQYLIGLCVMMLAVLLCACGAKTDENSSTTEETQIQETEYPGADVVMLVNLRGDETTAYKLADGTYLDRIDRHFTYNGTDTWTDEEGVEWNEVAQ